MCSVELPCILACVGVGWGLAVRCVCILGGLCLGVARVVVCVCACARCDVCVFFVGWEGIV